MVIRRLKRMAGSFVSGAFIASMLCVGAVYFLLFHKPPTDDIINANKQKRSNREVRESNLLEKDTKDMTAAEYSRARWDAWITVNDLVSIGTLYNKCGKPLQIVPELIQITS